ncbi:MAG: metallophosphatase, partial [Saprospiraceae bacterium]|nr:metallophosphatase [Saprospiraceae bacterium]
LAALDKASLTRLTILHTNDVHSRIEPFPMDGSRRQGLGGAARRAALIERIRRDEEHVLLFDAGDIFQGTPYFNYFGGELEFKLMSAMQYDAATIGNHDFDAGVDGLARQMPHASFDMVISNYDMSDTPMSGKTHPYRIYRRGGVRIGVLGVGIELRGLVPEALYGATRYLDPVQAAQTTAGILRHDEKCDYVICLSHLGYRYRGDKISDVALAGQTRDIDLIIGGHTHTFLDAPEVVANRDGKPIYINQAGWGGMRLGRLDITFERNRKEHCTTCENLWIKADS